MVTYMLTELILKGTLMLVILQGVLFMELQFQVVVLVLVIILQWIKMAI